jgi:hypothetical protein
MSEFIDKDLILENKIALLNRLSVFYQISGMFFGLSNDIIMTANEQFPSETETVSGETMGRILAARIRRIIENSSLLETTAGDDDEYSRKKTELKRKLIKLTKDSDT